MKTVKTYIPFLFILNSIIVCGQSIKGIVLDANTNEPIESASIYFDNTSIGTSTNDKGIFEIEQKEGVTSALVISFLGYERVLLETYNSKEYYKILLIESIDSLDEVVISTNDGMPRAIKLEQFRQQFLGFSELSESCTILNEDDLILRYNKISKELSASAKTPIIIRNESLKYIVHFEIRSFSIQYSYINIQENRFHVNQVGYTGTTFYESFANKKDKSTLEKRENAYQGSILHFMRALSKDKIEDEDFEIYSGGFKVKPSNYIFLRSVTDKPDYINVRLLKPLNILYKRKRQSSMMSRVGDFIIDPYGNFSPLAILFGGDMGDQRVGDLLPFDYILPAQE